MCHMFIWLQSCLGDDVYCIYNHADPRASIVREMVQWELVISSSEMKFDVSALCGVTYWQTVFHFRDIKYWHAQVLMIWHQMLDVWVLGFSRLGPMLISVGHNRWPSGHCIRVGYCTWVFASVSPISYIHICFRYFI